MATKNSTNSIASAAELNILDGATLTTTELNYVDGVTSAIQTQIDGKVTSGGALGTPTSGTVTNLTGTASININGTVGATTPTTATFTTATINTSLLPDADDGAVLGASGTGFSDLFLASGAVINSAAGTATLTFGSTIASNVDVTVPDEAYGTGWNGSLEVPSKNAVYDKIETISSPTCVSVIPRPAMPDFTTSTTVLSVNTTAYVGKVEIPFAITTQKITISVSANDVNGTLKIALFSEDGGTRVFSVTTASITGTGDVSTAIGSTVVAAGVYYIVILPVSTANITVRSYVPGTIATQLQVVTSEPSYIGTYTVTASTMPATITIASIAGGADACLGFRLDN